MEYLILCVILAFVLAAAAATLALVTFQRDFILNLPDWNIFALLTVTAAASAVYGYFFYAHISRLYSPAILTLPAAASGLAALLCLIRQAVQKRGENRAEPVCGRSYLLLTEAASFLFFVLVTLAFSGIYLFCHLAGDSALSLTLQQFSYLDYHLCEVILITLGLGIITDVYRIYLFFYRADARAEEMAEMSGKELRNLKRRIRAGR